MSGLDIASCLLIAALALPAHGAVIGGPIYFQGHTYHVLDPGTQSAKMQEAMDLSTAGEICYLVIIGSEEENNFVKAQKGDDTRIWTGGVEDPTDVWVWKCPSPDENMPCSEHDLVFWLGGTGENDGVPVPGVYNDWPIDEPNDLFVEGSMEINEEGVWNDLTGQTDFLGFVECEVRPPAIRRPSVEHLCARFHNPQTRRAPTIPDFCQDYDRY